MIPNQNEIDSLVDQVEACRQAARDAITAKHSAMYDKNNATDDDAKKAADEAIKAAEASFKQAKEDEAAACKKLTKAINVGTGAPKQLTDEDFTFLGNSVDGRVSNKRVLWAYRHSTEERWNAYKAKVSKRRREQRATRRMNRKVKIAEYIAKRTEANAAKRKQKRK